MPKPSLLIAFLVLLPFLAKLVHGRRSPEEWKSRVAIYQLLTDRFSTGKTQNENVPIENWLVFFFFVAS